MNLSPLHSEVWNLYRPGKSNMMDFEKTTVLPVFMEGGCKDAGGDRVTVKVRTMFLVTRVLMGVTETVEVGDGDSDRDIPSVMLATICKESWRAPCTDQSLK